MAQVGVTEANLTAPARQDGPGPSVLLLTGSQRSYKLQSMRFTSLALCLVLVACGNSEDHHQTLAPTILNGSPDPGHPAVGTVKGGPNNCTATLLGSKTVLLAAHCIKDDHTYTFALGGKSYAVDKRKPHAGWKTVYSVPELPKADWMFSIHDIGIVILAQPVQGIKPMHLAMKKPAVGTPVTLIGFGSGQKEMAKNLVGAIGEDFVLYGTMAGMKGTNGLTCTDDSGGPTLVKEDGEERILGVHSTANCIDYVQDTRVSTHMTWLKAQSSEITDPPDAGTPKPDASPPDAQIPDASPPLADSNVGLEPKAEPETGCSVGNARGVQAALLLLLLLGMARARP